MVATFVVCRKRVNSFLELSDEIAIFDSHNYITDSCIMVDKDVGFPFGVSYCATIMRHSLIGRVCLWCTTEAINEFPYVFRTCVDMAPSRTFCQLSVLASFMASLASLHALIHFCWFF